MEILNAFGNEVSQTAKGMQPFRKSKSRLLPGLLGLVLIMYYLLPEGHFLTEYTFSAPTVGLDTKGLFAWALFHFLQWLEEKYEQNLVPKQGTGAIERLTLSPTQAAGHSPEKLALSFSLPLAFFMTLFKILKPRLSQTPNSPSGCSYCTSSIWDHRALSDVSNDPVSTGCRNVTTDSLGFSLPGLCFPH